MGLNDRDKGGGGTADSGSQWDRVLFLKPRIRKTMTLASVWKGKTETGILCCEVLRLHRDAFNVTLSQLPSDTLGLSL